MDGSRSRPIVGLKLMVLGLFIALVGLAVGSNIGLIIGGILELVGLFIQ